MDRLAPYLIGGLSLSAFILPLLLAFQQGTLTDDAVRAKVSAFAPPSLDAAPQRWRVAVETLDNEMLDSAEKGIPKVSQLKLRSQLEALSDANDKQFRGFYPHIQMFLFPWMIAVLGALLWWLARSGNGWLTLLEDGARWRRGGAVLYFIVHGPHLVRPLIHSFGQTIGERHIWSYVHWDISVASFVLDQGFFACVCFEVAMLCVLLSKPSRDSAQRRDLQQVLTGFSEAFFEWQVTSLALALAFLYLTTVYWRVIWKFHSAEHLPSAALAHLLWAFVWGVASLRLKRDWDDWQSARQGEVFNVRARLSTGSIDADTANASLALLQQLHPVGIWAVVGSAIAAIASFVAPILKALIDAM